MKKLVLAGLLALLTLPGHTASQYTLDTNDDGNADQWYVTEGELVLEMRMDRDHDGIIDYLAQFNHKDGIVYEEFDFNFDGKMDDFYFYDDDGLLVRQEIDSNYDEQIDIWVYLFEGMYIKRFERDMDFDGEVDLVKDYEQG